MLADKEFVWVTRTTPHLAYAPLTKCACSSIGQLLHRLDHHSFADELVHSKKVDLLRSSDSQERLAEVRQILSRAAVTRFTFVRNPYRRLLSAFADKILGFQANGRRYRGGAIHVAMAPYGARWGPRANLFETLGSFVRLAVDTMDDGAPMAPDPHWLPMTRLLRERTAWDLDFIGRVESFSQDLTEVLARAGATLDVPVHDLPRDNATALPKLGMAAYFGSDERRLVERAYAEDFELLRYSTDPTIERATGRLDLAEVNRAIRAEAR